MRFTDEQKDYTEFLRGQLIAAGLLRVRVKPDLEGFPIVPGRLGQVEYYGPEPSGDHRLRVYTTGRLMRGLLLKVPGVHPQQMGEGEARLWFPAHDDPACLNTVCGLIKAKMRREGGGRSSAELAAIRPQRISTRSTDGAPAASSHAGRHSEAGQG